MARAGLSHLPSVDHLLLSATGVELVKDHGRQTVVDAIRLTLQNARENVIDGQPAPVANALMQQVSALLREQTKPSLRPVFNLTGTVLHTNLGRAPLPASAIARMVEVASRPSNLEYDLGTGERGDRDVHIEALIVEITGAEAATVVNNNAAAVLLTLNTLAQNRAVPVSRGELVEIGGAFRIPDIMGRAGCRLVEVGTTNRTHLDDYRRAITDETALLMKVHTSNYHISGFTKSVTEDQLAELAHAHQLAMVTDLGSGTLIDLTRYGLPYEPTAQEAIRQGADIVTFSGDKLLGGPQAGIIIGKRDLIGRIKANPMKRALRVDKLTLAALFEVLKLYRDPDSLAIHLPTLRWLSRSVGSIRETAIQVEQPLRRRLDGIGTVAIEPCLSQIGSGSLPVERLPSCAVVIRPTDARDSTLTSISLAFRRLPIPVIGRLHDGAFMLDLRTLEESAEFIHQLSHLSLP